MILIFYTKVVFTFIISKFFLVLFKRDCDVKISYLLSFMLFRIYGCVNIIL